MNVYRGNIVHSKSFNDFEIIVDGFLAVQDGNVSYNCILVSFFHDPISYIIRSLALAKIIHYSNIH